jgi:hypothetical protein
MTTSHNQLFKIDLTKGTFSGPKQYMEEQGNNRLDQILTGEHTLFNQMSHLSPDPETAILVWMQTDYAEWLGAQQVKTWMPSH